MNRQDRVGHERHKPRARLEQGRVYRLGDGVPARKGDGLWPTVGDQLIEADLEAFRLWLLDEQGERRSRAVGTLFAYEWRRDGPGLWEPLYYATGGDLGDGWHVLRGTPIRIDLAQLEPVSACEELRATQDEVFLDLMAEWDWH